ncbi:MAG TPA: COX15/CtaA family protein [Silvibacterium sp.]|nr:COX15/CtaA family protein [Silvibacterium sp.]
MMNAATAAISATPAPSHADSPALNRYAWAVLVYNVAVVLWGAAVRATGSGAGCGDHWPLCNGSVIQHYPTAATLIEFAHRAMSGVALIAVFGLLFWIFRATPRRHLARAASIAALVLTLNEALLGALLVLLGKVAHDQSASRAVYLALHLTNTLLLLGALALTAHFLSRKQGFMRGSVEFRAPGLILTGLIALLVVGVTGSLAALGDTLYPATSLRAALAQDFSSSSSWLVRLRWAHPAVSLLAGVFLLWLIFHGTRSAANRRLSLTVAALLLLQYTLGLADILLLAPTWMQLVHLLGADLLWITLIVLAARLCVRPIGCTEGICPVRTA